MGPTTIRIIAAILFFIIVFIIVLRRKNMASKRKHVLKSSIDSVFGNAQPACPRAGLHSAA